MTHKKQGGVEYQKRLLLHYRLLETSPCAILLLLFVVATLGTIIWAFLLTYGLRTAFFGLVVGMILLWFLSLITDLREHGRLLLTPIMLGILGYLAEMFDVWAIPSDVTLLLQWRGMILGKVVLPLSVVLLMVIGICAFIQLVLAIYE